MTPNPLLLRPNQQEKINPSAQILECFLWVSVRANVRSSPWEAAEQRGSTL